MGGDGGQQAGSDGGPQAAAYRHLPLLVTANLLPPSRHYLSPLVYSSQSPLVTAGHCQPAPAVLLPPVTAGHYQPAPAVLLSPVTAGHCQPAPAVLLPPVTAGRQ